jgi:hypothetical protein
VPFHRMGAACARQSGTLDMIACSWLSRKSAKSGGQSTLLISTSGTFWSKLIAGRDTTTKYGRNYIPCIQLRLGFDLIRITKL